VNLDDDARVGAAFREILTQNNFDVVHVVSGYLLGGQVIHSAKAAGLDALLDDREERPGVKFKDADLIGIPYRITLGKKLPQGLVEVVDRKTKKSTDVPVADAANAMEWLVGYECPCDAESLAWETTVSSRECCTVHLRRINPSARKSTTANRIFWLSCAC
jgi:hypothetical protein